MGWRWDTRSHMKKAQREKNALQRIFSYRLSSIVLCVLIVGMLATLGVVVWQKSTTQSVGDYEGVIVDRWADYAESDQGSRPRMALVVQANEGKRFTVRVDPNVYESARVGMRIRSISGQIVLIDTDRKSAGK